MVPSGLRPWGEINCCASARSAVLVAQGVAGLLEAVVDGVEAGGHVGMHKQNMFQSTLPARGATGAWVRGRHDERVSIHAPGEGSDVDLVRVRRLRRVSIHAPGEGSDARHRPAERQSPVSIHAPGEGSDPSPLVYSLVWVCFNPRSRRGERRPGNRPTAQGARFNPRSRRGERRVRPSCAARRKRFNPRSRRGERPACTPARAGSPCFNPRSRRGERPVASAAAAVHA